MTSFVATANRASRFGDIFKPRDIFLHDGKSLRRFTIGAKLQMAVVGAIAFSNDARRIAYVLDGAVRLRRLRW